METPETGGDQWRLQRLGETSGDSRDWGRPVETPETGGDHTVRNRVLLNTPLFAERVLHDTLGNHGVLFAPLKGVGH